MLNIVGHLIFDGCPDCGVGHHAASLPEYRTCGSWTPAGEGVAVVAHGRREGHSRAGHTLSCAADTQTEEERLENINVEPEPEYDEDGRGEIIDNTPKDTFDDVEDIEDAGDEPFQGGGDAGEKPSQ